MGDLPCLPQQAYIPWFERWDEDLKLAPIDESEEEKKKRLLEETFQITQEILQTKSDKKHPEHPGLIAAYQGKPAEDLTKSIISYIRYITRETWPKPKLSRTG